MSGKRDHFNVLVVCALQAELQAARHVLENQTNSMFVYKYDDLCHLNMMVCERWNKTPLKVAISAQRQMGGIECQRHVSELGNYFTANVVAMTGVCAGDENKYGNVQHGSVVIAKRTTVVVGGKKKSADEFQTLSHYCDLNRRINGAIDQLVTGGSSWVKYIPDDVKRPSPRFVRDLILECVLDNPNIEKRRLLQEMVIKNLPGMTKVNHAQILEIMQEQDDPWIRAEGKFHDRFVATDTGKQYVKTDAGFLRDDVIIGIVDSMVAISDVPENLKEQMKILKKQTGDRKLKGVDMESHNFMQQTLHSFAVDEKPGIGVVMKGISDYGSQENKVDYYQVFAASTSAAFLRHLMTEEQFLFETRKSALGGDERGTRAVRSDINGLVATIDANAIIQAVVDSGAHLWFDIGQRMGLKVAKLTSLTANKTVDSSKLRALIAAKQAKLGNTKAMELLLSACQDVQIYGAVVEDLQGS